MNDYSIFGWRIRSELPIPDLLPWQGDGRDADVTIEVGPVPPVTPDLTSFSPAVQIGPSGVRVSIPAVADYWVEAGRRIIVDPSLPRDAPDIRVFLLGTVFAALCFQRGVLPLHASAIDMDGQALLISGVSGAGKSTLAAAFSARGYRLLSDDLCAVTINEPQGVLVYPAFPRVKLWKDTASQLQIPTDGLERSRMELEKVHLPIPAPLFQAAPLPPTQIILLRTEPSPDQRETRFLRGLAALRRFDIIHRWRLGLAMGQQALILQGLARLVERAPVAEVARSDNFADLPELVDRVRALAEMPRG